MRAPAAARTLASYAERTFVAIKPDALQRGLSGTLISRFESRGLQLCAMKMLVPSRDLTEEHYAEHRGKPFFDNLVEFLTSGPVLASAWSGRNAVRVCRDIIGPMGPNDASPDAPYAPPGTIRGDYSVHWRRNLVHGSDSVDAAERELALWFEPSELAVWTRAAEPWVHELPRE